MNDNDEIARLRERVSELEELLATARIDIEVLSMENSALDKQRLNDARRLASRGLE
jgi:hypothetical protein